MRGSRVGGRRKRVSGVGVRVLVSGVAVKGVWCIGGTANSDSVWCD